MILLQNDFTVFTLSLFLFSSLKQAKMMQADWLLVPRYQVAWGERSHVSCGLRCFLAQRYTVLLSLTQAVSSFVLLTLLVLIPT